MLVAERTVSHNGPPLPTPTLASQLLSQFSTLLSLCPTLSDTGLSLTSLAQRPVFPGDMQVLTKLLHIHTHTRTCTHKVRVLEEKKNPT